MRDRYAQIEAEKRQMLKNKVVCYEVLGLPFTYSDSEGEYLPFGDYDRSFIGSDSQDASVNGGGSLRVYVNVYLQQC